MAAESRESVMSDPENAQSEPQARDPWAPPERRVSLGKPDPRPQPAPPAQTPAMPVHQAYRLPTAPVPPGAAQPPGGVPPVPPAPTGPGTPSAYQGDPYGGGPGFPPPLYPQGPYGYPGGPYGPGGWQAPAAPNNGFGIAALVLGIVGLVLSWTMLFGVVLGVLAIVFGAIGRGKGTKGEATNRGQALAGLILGGVAVVASVLMFIAVVHYHDHGTDDPQNDDPDATYGAYLPAPPGPAPLVFDARR